MRKSWWLVIAGLLSIVGAWMWLGSAGKFTCIYGCHTPSDPAADSSALFLGQLAALSGPLSAHGQSARRGAELAIRTTNLSEPVIKRRIGLLAEDDRGDGGASPVAAAVLVRERRVPALLIGLHSPLGEKTARLAADAGIPVIVASGSGTALPGTVFRIGFSDSAQAHALASFARTRLKAERAAILHQAEDPYSSGLTEAFARDFRAAGGRVVSRNRYSAGDTTFGVQLGAIRESLKGDGRSVLFVPGHPAEAARIARQAREAGISAFLLGGDGWHAQALLERGEKSLNGAHFATHFTSERHAPTGEGFVEAFKTLYGRDATPDAAAALAYDATMMVIDALRRAGLSDPDALRDTLATMEFPGVTGIIDFDRDGNAAGKPVVIMKIENGEFAYVETIGH